LLKKYKIPVVDYKEIKKSEELSKLKYPQVLKAISPKIIHKTEKGAVKICNSVDEAEKIFPKLKKMGTVLAQKFVEGQYTIIGVKKDPIFGQVIMFGLGGIFVEVMKDISFRVCPITRQDAREMTREIKAYPILAGERGEKLNLKAVEDTLVKVSNLAIKKDIEELDINPFIINKKEGKAVDIRIVV
jgi:acetyl-CoA synthetase (ADP-forming)